MSQLEFHKFPFPNVTDWVAAVKGVSETTEQIPCVNPTLLLLKQVTCNYNHVYKCLFIVFS